MALDPSIALQGLLINRNDERLKQQRLQQGQMEMDQARQQSEDKRRLADLLPHALQGDQGAMQQVAGLDPQLYMRLDDQQRAAVKAQFDDMGAAVRWSMQDPAQRAQRWNQVVDFYSRQHPQIAQYRDHPEMAEQALMQLGQMGEYLNGMNKSDGTTLQRNYEFFAGKDPKLAEQYLRNEAEGSPLIASNGDGTFTIIPRGYGTGTAPSAGGSSVPSQAVEYLKAHPELAPQFDQKYGAGAAQRALGGQMGSGPSGGFL